MLLNLLEVHEEIEYNNKAGAKKVFSLRNVVVNRRFITFMREDSAMNSYLQDGLLPSSLDKNQRFTRISIARGNIGQDLVVVGDLAQVTSWFNSEDGNKKKTLKG